MKERTTQETNVARPCPQDCTRCGIQQQVFCCTQMLFDMTRAHQECRRAVTEVEKAVADIAVQLHPKDDDGQLSIPFIEKP